MPTSLATFWKLVIYLYIVIIIASFEEIKYIIVKLIQHEFYKNVKVFKICVIKFTKFHERV